MLVHRGIQCRILANNTTCIETVEEPRKDSDPPDLIRATVVMRSRQCFAIRWNSTEAITASCKVWVVTPTSTRTKLVAATFMDKECPETQTRNSSEHLKVRALRAGNAGRTSDGLGTVRLEIHRAQNTVIGFRRTKPNQTCGAFKFECTKDATVGKLPFVTFEFQMVLGTPSMEVIKCGGADDGTDEGSQYIESQALGSQHTGMVLPGSCPVTEAHNPGQCSGAQKRKRQRQRPRAWSGDDISDGIQEVNQNELDRVKRTKAQNDKLESMNRALEHQIEVENEALRRTELQARRAALKKRLTELRDRRQTASVSNVY